MVLKRFDSSKHHPDAQKLSRAELKEKIVISADPRAELEASRKQAEKSAQIRAELQDGKSDNLELLALNEDGTYSGSELLREVYGDNNEHIRELRSQKAELTLQVSGFSGDENSDAKKLQKTVNELNRILESLQGEQSKIELMLSRFKLGLERQSDRVGGKIQKLQEKNNLNKLKADQNALREEIEGLEKGDPERSRKIDQLNELNQEVIKEKSAHDREVGRYEVQRRLEAEEKSRQAELRAIEAEIDDLVLEDDEEVQEDETEEVEKKNKKEKKKKRGFFKRLFAKKNKEESKSAEVATPKKEEEAEDLDDSLDAAPEELSGGINQVAAEWANQFLEDPPSEDDSRIQKFQKRIPLVTLIAVSGFGYKDWPRQMDPKQVEKLADFGLSVKNLDQIYHQKPNGKYPKVKLKLNLSKFKEMAPYPGATQRLFDKTFGFNFIENMGKAGLNPNDHEDKNLSELKAAVLTKDTKESRNFTRVLNIIESQFEGTNPEDVKPFQWLFKEENAKFVLQELKNDPREFADQAPNTEEVEKEGESPESAPETVETNKTEGQKILESELLAESWPEELLAFVLNKLDSTVDTSAEHNPYKASENLLMHLIYPTRYLDRNTGEVDWEALNDPNSSIDFKVEVEGVSLTSAQASQFDTALRKWLASKTS